MYYLIEYREWRYRRSAVEALRLKPGDTVVEVGCGTGSNFKLLQEKVGTRGRIIGVDLNEAMLERSRLRVKQRGWTNVDITHSDAALFRFPEGINGVISTFAITLVPEFDEIIKRGSRALKKGGRFVVLDLKLPDKRPRVLRSIGVFFTKPFGALEETAKRRPWESIQKYLTTISFEELYFGFSYIVTGERNHNQRQRELLYPPVQKKGIS